MSRVISDSRPDNPGTTPHATRTQSNTPGRISDPIGRALILIFLTKPFIDLFWEYFFFIGPIRLSPTTVVGFLIVGYFLPFRFKHAQIAPPFARIFEAFFVLNLAGVLIGLLTTPGARAVSAIDTQIRILGCYLVFFGAYAAARRYQYTDARPFITAIVIGSAIAVIINLVAIKLGYGGVKIGSEYSRGPHREVGLYFDAGTLGNMAFFNFTFTVFAFGTARSRKTLWLLVTIASALVDLYLIAISGSRAPLVMLTISAMGYLWYLRGWARIAAPILGALLLLAVGTLFLDDSSPVLERLEGDVAALQSDDPGVSQSMSGRVSLGKFEALGNNRGLLWANALTELFRQPAADIVFGSYFSKIRAHSDYIDIMARNGIVGLGLYVFLIYGLFLKTLASARSATRNDHRMIQILACVLLACYAFNCFPFRPLVYTTTNWYMWTIVALALAAGRQVSRRPTPEVASHSESTAPSRALPRPGRSGA